MALLPTATCTVLFTDIVAGDALPASAADA